MTTLDNGVRVISSLMAHTRSACVCIFVGAGSRYETPEQAGVSHFVEHLCFKGTERRASAKEISEAIEGIGGVLNGGTDKELTVYWAKVARTHFDLAVDLLLDMLCHSKFDPAEVEKERKVIIEELNMSFDSPQQRVDLLVDELLWPEQPLGRDVAGSKETVSVLTREAMLEYVARQYTPGNAVVSVAGDVSHEQALALLHPLFADWAGEAPGLSYPAEDSQDAPRFRLEHRKTEQAHLCLGLRGLSSVHPDRYTLDLLNIILGEGMSSRLFLELREHRGLAYDIHSYVSHFRDSGSMIIYTGVDPRLAEASLEVVLSELQRLKEQPVPEPELNKAKEMGKGRLLLRMEDSRSVAGWTGGQELLTGQIRSVDEVISLVDAISAAEVQRLAQRLFTSNSLNMAVVGPLRSGRKLEKQLRL